LDFFQRIPRGFSGRFRGCHKSATFGASFFSRNTQFFERLFADCISGGWRLGLWSWVFGFHFLNSHKTINSRMRFLQYQGFHRLLVGKAHPTTGNRLIGFSQRREDAKFFWGPFFIIFTFWEPRMTRRANRFYERSGFSFSRNRNGLTLRHRGHGGMIFLGAFFHFLHFLFPSPSLPLFLKQKICAKGDE
jgi:hypothetical protein